MRYLGYCDFVGTDYVGWQVQPNGISVQGSLEHVLTKLVKGTPRVTGCGRTDAGVHGRHYAFHFDTEESIDVERVRFKANSMLPKTIAISSITSVSDDFHARFSALSRAYIYSLHTEKNPFLEPYSWYYPRLKHADTSLIQPFLDQLLSVNDFKSLSKTGSDNKTSLVKMYQAQWIINGHQHELHIKADRFLRGMVRLIVGLCTKLALEKISIDEVMHQIIEAQPLSHAYSAPAHGLCFIGTAY